MIRTIGFVTIARFDSGIYVPVLRSESHAHEEHDACRSDYWFQTSVLTAPAATHRDAILAATNDKRLMTRPPWASSTGLCAFGMLPRCRCQWPGHSSAA